MKKDDDDDDELDGDNEETYIEGYINITYAQLDLFELQQVYTGYERNLPPEKIDN